MLSLTNYFFYFSFKFKCKLCKLVNLINNNHVLAILKYKSICYINIYFSNFYYY